MAPIRRVLTFDLDGVLCRPPFGINPGRNIDKRRKTEGKATALAPTEPFRYFGRRPMPGAREGFLWLTETYDCRIVTARTERTRSATEGWLRRWLGTLPELYLRPDYSETPAAYKVRTTQELGALAHFEDDPHTAQWVAEHIPAVFLVDWWRNRWLRAENVHRIQWIGEAGAILRSMESEPV
ncbi:MAG: hypothetical protein AB7T37_16415 [Dehalococcoidia bacterium]